MEYRITKEELGNNWLYSTLYALSRCMAIKGIPLYVVGATARDIAMKLLNVSESKRRTKDLDVAIAIDDWKNFDDICRILAGNYFKRIGMTQKFIYSGENGNIDYEVDIVPFGGVAVDEKICWPPEGNPVMSVKCFQDVMKEAVTVVVDDTFEIKMAPLCGQFLIKLDSWNDRNMSTDKDAEDMLFILRNYFDAQLLHKKDAVPPDAVTLDDENSDAVIWGSQWLAYDVCKLLTTEHLEFYVTFINGELEKGEHSMLVYHFMKYYANGGAEDISDYYEPCRRIWNELGKIFNNELENRKKR